MIDDEIETEALAGAGDEIAEGESGESEIAAPGSRGYMLSHGELEHVIRGFESQMEIQIDRDEILPAYQIAGDDEVWRKLDVIEWLRRIALENGKHLAVSVRNVTYH